MDLREVKEYLTEIGKYGIVPGLDNIRRLCGKIGNPQQSLSFVHIAGTNGKGSVLAYISTILLEAGYRVGRYSSPAVFEYGEQFQVDGRNIPEHALCEGMEYIQNACADIVSEGFSQPTPFEVETALAFWYFSREKCDIVVLEAGMGGMEDATNIVEDTRVAVLTPIGLDHMQFLGGTLEEIALQKAGIIKQGAAVVSSVQPRQVMRLIEETARREGCGLTVADGGCAGNVQCGLEGQSFDFLDMRELQISLCGKFQIANAVTAVLAAEQLRIQGMQISEDAVRAGLKKTVWRGRFQILHAAPYFIIDGAHNEDAVGKLMDTLDFYFTNRRIIYIMGMLKDKECEKVAAMASHRADKIITVTPPENPRALTAEQLAEMAGRHHGCVQAADSLEIAVETAWQSAGKEDVILVFGSLSFLGRITEIAEHVF